MTITRRACRTWSTLAEEEKSKPLLINFVVRCRPCVVGRRVPYASVVRALLIALSLLAVACPRTVEKGLPACADVDVGEDESDDDVDCVRFPQLCDLPVDSEPDPGGTPVDLVFVAVGGLRQGSIGITVDALVESARGNPRSIIGHRYWKAIVGNGGEASACGWCKDKWTSPGKSRRAC